MLVLIPEVLETNALNTPEACLLPGRAGDERKNMQHRVQSGVNLLLESLSEANRQRLRRLMEPVGLPRRTEIFKSGETPRYAHFITSGLNSVVLTLSDGADMEISVNGVEGLAGWIHLLGPQPVQAHAFMQIEGTALRMPMVDLKREFEADPELRSAILAYGQHQLLVSHQLIACNRKHSVEQRLSRWLLMVKDRVGIDNLPLTQEFLADMLGSRRTSVGTAIGHLESRGLIEGHRGNIRLLSEAGLRKQACECYSVIDGYYQRLYK